MNDLNLAERSAPKSNRRLKPAAVAAIALAAVGASAQGILATLKIDSTTSLGLIGATTIGPDWRVVNTYTASFKNSPTMAKLLSFANKTYGITAKPQAEAGIMTDYTVRFHRDDSGLYGDMNVETIAVPIPGVGKKGETAAVLISYYKSTPQLACQRLLVRAFKNSWSPYEYAVNTGGTVTETKGTKAECLWRSPLRLVEVNAPLASQALRSTFDSLIGSPVFAELSAGLDVRQRPIGQGELLLSTAAFTASCPEFEYGSAYVSGTLNKAPDLNWTTKDSAAMKLVKELLKSILSSIRAQIGKEFLAWLASFLGF